MFDKDITLINKWFNKSTKANEYKIIGAFHGINLDADSNVPEDQLPPDVKNPKHFVFGDPAAYDKMSEADKEELMRMSQLRE